MKDPKIAQKMPYVMDMKAGKYAFCTCGESNKQPFCDGKHAGGEFRPEIMVLEEDKKIAWCGCKNSKKGAFCDGTHSKI